MADGEVSHHLELITYRIKRRFEAMYFKPPGKTVGEEAANDQPVEDDGSEVSPEIHVDPDSDAILMTEIVNDGRNASKDTRVTESIKATTVETQVFDQCRQEAWTYKEAKVTAFNQAIKKLIENALKNSHVIVGTTITSDDLHRMDKFNSTLAILDEAGQVGEPQALTATGNTPTAKAYILIGDNKQLSPTVVFAPRKGKINVDSELPVIDPAQDEDDTGSEDGDNESESGEAPSNELYQQITWLLLARLLELGFPAHLMTIQQRAVPGIAHLWYSLVYSAKVSNGDRTAVVVRPDAVAFQAWVKTTHGFDNTSVIFIDTENSKFTFAAGTKSGKNEDFALEAKSINEALNQNHGIAKNDVAVVTPYTGQVITYSMSGVPTAHTVDSSQGSEFSIVVYDLVGAGNGERPIHFIEDGHRLNVGISRARNGLIIIGDSRVVTAKPRSTESNMSHLLGKVFANLQELGPVVKKTFDHPTKCNICSNLGHVARNSRTRSSPGTARPKATRLPNVRKSLAAFATSARARIIFLRTVPTA
ncbi:uncharacterized protein K452DRAFT_344929 [Aplosporella prunicola CBS 121167]|uniref:DNA2/NAM7 helicase-like C-terminal domain-containing protein n=1 Tax=Aplosporella prunicola CBS 121167 TaxID=1176127 RepID=A0A6A6BNI7_9PEZI|nr:uncharacterized protein K452DRAFT_344929 [Aplosporella prunicola CBS 121167]KAF2144804.1 hypothetical protein K452DRAFT_344929 [Aplosporella prunicola CBS 121167]